ncbi:HAD family hydrolase [Solibacillus sp. FSL K6-1523]|uniref:HAD family hydrolase n=1 Tax=Solibacillus sp. FSL K6-1523 TaxID=2921471 RepID=UPI0030F96D13
MKDRIIFFDVDGTISQNTRQAIEKLLGNGFHVVAATGRPFYILENVNLGIAMGNANEKLKSIANFITEYSGEDGIVWALKRFKLI